MDGAAWPWSFGDSEKVPDVQIKWIWSKRSNLKNWTCKVSPMLFLSDRVHCTVITFLSNCTKCHHCSILHVVNVITVLSYMYWMSSLFYPICHHCYILHVITVLSHSTEWHHCSILQHWMSSIAVLTYSTECHHYSIQLSYYHFYQLSTIPGGRGGRGGGVRHPLYNSANYIVTFYTTFCIKSYNKKGTTRSWQLDFLF